jgi:hypothetical protein
MFNNKIKLYLFAILLFLMSYLLASQVILSAKTSECNYLKLIFYFVAIVLLILQIIHLSKIENKPK